MTTSSSPDPDRSGGTTVRAGNAVQAVYGFGLIGAVLYFVQHASSFWTGVLGILQALVWPAIVVYKALEYFHV